MKISTILDLIDIGNIALPEFQRGYVWNREQVRRLFDSLYHRHPVGSLLVWTTESKESNYCGNGQLTEGSVDLLLDGQQRISSLYGVIRRRPPKFFDGNAKAFTGLYFNLNDESFEFYQPMKMANDPLWIDVSELMANGPDEIGNYITRLSESGEHSSMVGKYVGRLTSLLSITDIDLHIDKVVGSDKSIEVVVDIFNRVNSGGTKLSKGDLALAKICANWPEGRGKMKTQIKTWQESGYNFNLDWLLRSVNTVVTGEAKFIHLHDRSAEEIKNGLTRAVKLINSALNMIGGRLGLDHDRVLFGRFAIPVMVRYLDQLSTPLSNREQDKLLFWYLQAGMWGRFSGSTESVIDQDLAAIEETGGGLERLIEQLRFWHGGLRVEPGHFVGWSLGARFYPVLYMLTRMGEAKDWGDPFLPLKVGMLGKMSVLEVHHIFPKSQLYDRGYKRHEVNALANFCFLTKETNLAIGNRLPEEYFPEVEKACPGALKSQWIPMDSNLWHIDNYGEFLEARKILLAEETNKRLEELLHDDSDWLLSPSTKDIATPTTEKNSISVVGGITSEKEEQELKELNTWVGEQGLPHGIIAYDFADGETGEQKAVFDLVWPEGVQRGLSQPVAVLLNEGAEVIALASGAGFRCFTSTNSFRTYIKHEIFS